MTADLACVRTIPAARRQRRCISSFFVGLLVVLVCATSVRTANGAGTFRGRTFEGRHETRAAPVLAAGGGGGGPDQVGVHVTSDDVRRTYCKPKVQGYNAAMLASGNDGIVSKRTNGHEDMDTFGVDHFLLGHDADVCRSVIKRNKLRDNLVALRDLDQQLIVAATGHDAVRPGHDATDALLRGATPEVLYDHLRADSTLALPSRNIQRICGEYDVPGRKEFSYIKCGRALGDVLAVDGNDKRVAAAQDRQRQQECVGVKFIVDVYNNLPPAQRTLRQIYAHIVLRIYPDIFPADSVSTATRVLLYAGWDPNEPHEVRPFRITMTRIRFSMCSVFLSLSYRSVDLARH